MNSNQKELFFGQPPTPLIGREDDLAAVTERILREDVRLLTLAGVAGIGKTRLAMAAANQLCHDFPQVILVDLASLSNHAQVLPTIAHSLGVVESVPGPLLERLTQVIGFRHYLLVMDNCEHVLEAMPEIGSLLTSCPNLKILATSREILRLKWEYVFPVTPLQLPELKSLPAPDTLARVPAVTLFIQRAQSREASFLLTTANSRIVAELCIHLEGLPLAIELAATHIGLLSPEILLARLSRSLNLTAGGTRDAPARHQTMWASIDWSYQLLNPMERLYFQRLAVFSGGWRLSAAEGVCCGDGIEADQILPLLEALVNSSLVLVDELIGVEKRYRFLETIREYAGEKLRQSGQENSLRKRHRDWFLSWAEKGEPDLWGPKMKGQMDQIEIEFPNLRAGLEWSRLTHEEAEAGIRLFAALSRFWDIRGYITEGRRLADVLLFQANEHSPARARTLVEAGLLAQHQGDWGDVQKKAAECLIFSRDIEDTLDSTAALMAMGAAVQGKGDFQQAAMYFDETITLARANAKQEPRALYMALFWVGQLACLGGDSQRAVPLLEEALILAENQGDPSFITGISIYLGRALLGQGDVKRASSILLEGMHSCHELGYWEGIAIGLDYTGQAARANKEYRHAIRLFAAASELRVKIGVVRWFTDPDYDRSLAETRAVLGEPALAAAQSMARAFSFDDIFDWALRPQETPARDKLTSAISQKEILTSREWEISCMIAQGLINRHIGDKLFISTRTVDAHVRHILDKLALNSRSQIAVWITSPH